MSDPSDSKDETLLPSQQQRVAGLRVGREVLRSGGPLAPNIGSFEVTDLIDVAAYVVDGTHPLERHVGGGESA